MGDESQRHPGVKRQAICIKPYKNEGVGFEVKLLEIIEMEPELKTNYGIKSKNYPKTVWVKNEKGWVWFFIKRKNDMNTLHTTEPKLAFFDDHFKELK